MAHAKLAHQESNPKGLNRYNLLKQRLDQSGTLKTAKLIRVTASKNNIVYADALVSDGSSISELGFSSEGGKYDALWSLVQRLNERGIELEGGAL